MESKFAEDEEKFDEGKIPEGKEEGEENDVREEMLRFMNDKRIEVDQAELQLDETLSKVAQEHADVLLEMEWDGDCLVSGKQAHRRYFEAGTQSCVEELMFMHVSDVKLNQSRPCEAFNEIRDGLFHDNPRLEGVLSDHFSRAGFGIAISDSYVYIVASFAYQMAEFENIEELEFRDGECTISGRMITSGSEEESKVDNGAYQPVGCTLTFYKESEERDIPGFVSGSEQHGSEGFGTVLAKFNPWEISYKEDEGTFSITTDIRSVLQRQRIYDIPHGVYDLRVYVAKAGEKIPHAESSKDFQFPKPGHHFCGCAAAVSYPPILGTKAFHKEEAYSRTKRVRQSSIPIESIGILPMTGEPLPSQYEVYQINGDKQTLPLLCFQKAGEKDDVQKCVVELAVAFGTDDVPPGFEVVNNVLDGTPMNLRNCWFIEDDHDDDHDEDDEDGSNRNKRDKPDTSKEEPIYLCMRTSEDPVEISTRALADVFLRRDSENKNVEFYEKLDVFPGSLHAMFRIVGMGAPDDDEFHEEDALADDMLEDSEDEDDELQGEGAQNNWAAMDDKEYDAGVNRLGKQALQGGELSECILPTAESKRAELEEAERVAQATRIESLIENAKQEREKLIGVNLSLQRSLVPFITKKKQQQQQQQDDSKVNEDSSALNALIANDEDSNKHDSSAQQEKERQYVNSLNACNDALDTLNRTREAYDKVAMELQTRLDEKEAKATEIRESFAHFKREIAKAAENSRTGKPIPMRIIKQFEETEIQKDGDVEKVRLKNINLRSQLRKLESALHEKEKLAEGLHLIDFEQLKIENQTLNEKIEERNEELHKLRKKTTTTVQVLTHIKEKLQFVQAEAVQLKSELSELDNEVTASRDQLTKSKHSRDALRTNNDARKRDQGFVNSSLLVQDYQKRKVEIKSLKRKIRDLQLKYANLTGQSLDFTAVGNNNNTASKDEEKRHE